MSRARPPGLPPQLRALIGRSRVWHAVMLVALGLLVWLVSAPTAHAQELYEWREPGGTVAYSQLPPRPRDGVLLRRLKIAELPDVDRPAAARLAAVSAPTGDVHAAAWQRADAKVAVALGRLQSAERAGRLGQPPRAGERQHVVDGHSRLSRSYFDRLALLDAAVVRARDALQAAYAERDALAIPR